MKKKPKRLTALLLSLLMVISLLPATGLTVEAATKPKLAKKSVSIVIGGTSKITVKDAPKGATITYKSAQKSIATVSKQGMVKGITSGTTKITVSVKKNSKTTKLTYKVTVKKPKLSKSKLSLPSGSTAKLSVKNKPKKAIYVWSSINSQIATVNKTGKVTAKTKGTTTIRVKIRTAKKTYSLSCKVTVKSISDNSDDVKQTYIVTFDSNGGSSVASQTVEKNAQAIRPTDPTRSGYTFDGWYTAASGGQKFDFNTMITGNITLYAHWINSQLTVNNLGISHIVQPLGHYINWAGISTVSQFADEQGRFCFAFCNENTVTIIKVNDTRITKTIQVPRLHPLLGAATCDDKGNLYLVWGHENEGTDTTVSTIFVSKYSSNGELIATVGGNGSEGLASYYNDGFYTKIPFNAGNCDVAVNGNLLLVNYAREMYSGHQSNGIFAVNTDDMTVNTNFVDYNSHSFDQRVTPFQSTGGFLIQSQGDCFPRAFTTAVTDTSFASAKVESFHFWVQNGTYNDYNMSLLNKTYARMGNILDSGGKAALVCSSVRSLSEKALDESYDVFIQIFDPTGRMDDANNYTTSGTRSGFGGNNGDIAVTDYGVKWLTNFAETEKTVDVVQAVTTNSGNIVVLYELYTKSTLSFDSTWYMILDTSGNVVRESQNLGDVRLNIDEDPIYINKTVQWVTNIKGSDELQLNVLTVNDMDN